MRFSDIEGHDRIKEHLRTMVDTDRIPHAILMGGPAGVGKTKMARALAQYIQCTDRRGGDSCGRCPSCLQHQAFSNPDLQFAFPIVKRSKPKRTLCSDYSEEWRRFLAESPEMSWERWLDLLEAGNSQPVIYVDEAAEISRTALLSSYASRYKVYLIWLPEKMGAEAANKLLKLMEEPWENTIFLLVSNEPGALLPTIFSRTQRVNFKPLAEGEVAAWLGRNRGLGPGDALRLAQRSEGSLLKAAELSLSGNESEEYGARYREMMRMAYGRKIADLHALAEEMAGEGRERIMRYLRYCARMARENYVYNLQLPALTAMSAQEEVFSQRFSPFVNNRNIEALARETDRALRDIARNGNPRIVLFDYMLQLARWIRR